jgi:hypothetical protein
VPAADLHAGEAVWRRDGSSGTVAAVAHTQHPQVRYHLTVDIAHTYFVGDGQWVVHNSCQVFPKGRPISELGKDLANQAEIYFSPVSAFDTRDVTVAVARVNNQLYVTTNASAPSSAR